MRDAKAFPFVYQEADRKTQATDRLAVAHLALMAEGGPESIDREGGTVASTCRVRYAWVFGYPELMRGGTFPQELRRRVAELEVDSPRMAVYKCVYDLIEGHLSGDEKAFYVKKFTAAATTGSAAPSRAESEGRAASGGGDGGDGGGFSDRDTSTSDGSGASEPVFGRAGVGATGGAGGSSAVMSSLADMIQRLEEHANVESAVLDRHNEELKNHNAFVAYSKIDHERLLARLKAELGASQASLAAVIAEIKKLYDDMAAVHAESDKVQAAARAEHERVVGELQARVDDLTGQLEACKLRAETLEGEKEGLERELAELRSQVLELEAENARLTAEVEEHKASHATLSGASDGDKRDLTAKLAERQGEIERLNLRVIELEGEVAALRLAHAATEGERAALATANAALVAELEGAKVVHLAALLASKKEAERLAAVHAREMEKWRKDNKQLRLDKEREETANVENLRSVHAGLEKYLKHSTRDFTADMRAVNATTTAANKGEKGLALLTDMLKGGRVVEFYGNVVPAETAKVEYSLPALFLICESIAGTWKMKKEGVSETVTEKLAYDCRVYDSIEQDALKQSRIKEYASPLFQEFVAAVKSAQV
jgi:predicted  nucleic acid-binding Zn-ribbon protein